MYCDGSLDEEGEYTVEALMLSRGQGESRKTFSRLRPGVLFSSGIMSTFFPFSTGLARDFSPLELRLFLLSAPDSNLFDDSSHIFQHCFIPFSHLSGILIIVKRKSPLTQFLFHNMAGKYPTSYRLLLLFIK